MTTGRTPPTIWWIKNVMHNICVHPWLPLADALDSLGFRTVPRAIYWAHDWTAKGLEGGG